MPNFNPAFVANTRPTIFIGIGGIGGRIMRRVRSRLQASAVWRDYKLEVSSFVVVDTNENDLVQYADDTDISKVHLSDSRHSNWLASQHNRADPFLALWRPTAQGVRKVSTIGAGQIRMESRTKLYLQLQYNNLETKLSNAFKSALQVSHSTLAASQVPEVYIFGSIAGGTCSGTALPMACLIRKVVADLGRGDPTIYGFFLLPEATEEHNASLVAYVHANGYAFMRELEHLTRSAYKDESGKVQPKSFHWRPPTGNERDLLVDRPPFDWVCFADMMPGMDLSDDDLLEAFADAAFVRVGTSIQVQVAGAQDNYTRFQTEVVRALASGGSGKRLPFGFTVHYGTIGAAVLDAPVERLRAYCEARFVARALNRALCGAQGEVSVDPSFDKLRLRNPEHYQMLLERKWLDSFREAADEEREKVVKTAEEVSASTGEKIEPEELAGDHAASRYLVDGPPTGTTSDLPDSFDDTTQEQPEGRRVPVLCNHKVGIEGDPFPGCCLFHDWLQSSTDVYYAQLLKKDLLVITSTNIAKFASELESRRSDHIKSKPHVAQQLRQAQAMARRGRWLVHIQDELGKQNQRLTPLAQRYLFTRLLTELDQQVDSVAASEKSAGASSYDQEESTWQSFFASASKAAAPDPVSFTDKLKSVVGFGDDTEAKDAKAAGLNQRLVNLRKSTNDAIRAGVVRSLLCGTREFLKRSLVFRQSLADRAGARRAELLHMAADLQGAAGLDRTSVRSPLGGTRLPPKYTVGLEALDSMHDALKGRLWDAFYEDHVAGGLDPLLKQTDLEVETLLMEEIQRASDAKQEPDPNLALKAIERRLADRVGDELADDFRRVPGARWDLATLLEMEAIYSMMPSAEFENEDPIHDIQDGTAAAPGSTDDVSPRETGRMRHEAFNQTRDLLAIGGTDAATSSKKTAVRDYMIAKLELLARNSIGLANVLKHVPQQMGQPIFDDRVFCTSPGFIGWLQHKHPDVHKALTTAAQQFQSQGPEAWLDPASMVVFSVVAFLPCCAFQSLDTSAKHYDNVRNARGAVTVPLHTDSRWAESDILPNLDYSMLQTKAEENARVQARKAALDLLRRCIRSNYVRKEKDTWMIGSAGVQLGTTSELVTAFCLKCEQEQFRMLIEKETKDKPEVNAGALSTLTSEHKKAVLKGCTEDWVRDVGELLEGGTP